MSDTKGGKSARADMPSLQALMDMYQCGLDFIESENEPDDGPDRDAMAEILSQLESMIQTEANEDPPTMGRSASTDKLRFAVAPITSVEVRDPTGNYDNTWTMSGYAAVFDETTTLYDGRYLRLTESISPKAFDRVLRDQGTDTSSGVVHFNFGHDMNRAVAATNVPAGQPGSLQLKTDSRGLYFEAKVARDDPDGIALASKMRTGVVSQASFAFTIGSATDETIETEDGPDTEHRTIDEVAHLYDVCACAQGAYSSTVSQLRGIAAAIGQPERPDPRLLGNLPTGGRQRQPALGGASDINPEPEGVVETPEPDWAAIDAMKARRRPIALDGT